MINADLTRKEMDMVTENKKLADAIKFAAKCHKDQVRKGTNIPYIVHPAEAMAIAATITGDREILAAAILHDVMEDAGVTYEKLVEKFGIRVADLVKAESEDKKADERGSWKERKQKTIDHLAKASYDVKLLTLCDKLSNIRAMARDEKLLKDKLWDLFNNNNKDDHAWYYRSIRDRLQELSGKPAFTEFAQLVDEVFGDENKK